MKDDICIELYNGDSIKNFRTRDEKNKYILQGENFCKTYEKMKGLQFINDENKVNIVFSCDNQTQLSKHSKFFQLLKSAYEYNLYKTNRLNWIQTEDNSLELLNFKSLEKTEKKIKSKKYCVYPPNILHVVSTYYLDIDPSLDKVAIVKKSEKIISHKKSIGGIIFDRNRQFLDFFVKNVSDKDHTMIVSDICPKFIPKNNVIFKHIKLINQNTSLTKSRMIVYYPTETVIKKLKEMIHCDILAPKFIWIVMPPFIKNSGISFNDVANILLWNKIENMWHIDSNLIGLKFKSPITTGINKGSINVETINYKTNILEQQLLKEMHAIDLMMLDKLYLQNTKKSIPKIIYDSSTCPICAIDFPDSDDEMMKGYLPCGHVMCSVCILMSLKIKHNCPICSKISKFSGIVIPNLEVNKIKYMMKLICRLYEKNSYSDKNILVYVDTVTLAKGLVCKINTELNKNNMDIKCAMVKENTKNCNKNILIVPTENSYVVSNIKNIKNVIVLAKANDYILQPESMGYDHCYTNENINVWLFEPRV